MTERKEILVQSCIDFRFARQIRQTQQENQSHLMATAGASLNPQEILADLKVNNDIIGDFVNLDHEDCGAYKNFAKDDSDINHQKHMDTLKSEIANIDPTIEFESTILRLDPQNANKHTTGATTIILGDPECLRIAFTRMEEENLKDNHDIIARPFNLENHESILNDLQISQKLHRPEAPETFSVFIFDRDEDNAQILENKVAQVVHDAKIETIIISQAQAEESVA